MFKRQTTFQAAKNNMGLVMLFTVINLVLTFWGTGLSFPFSLFSPWLLGLWTGLSLTQGFVGEAIIYASLGILVFGLFLGSYLALKKKPKLMIIGLVVYFLDTMIMTYIFMGVDMVEMFINVLFHLWVIYSLGSAVLLMYKKPTIENPMKEDEINRL